MEEMVGELFTECKDALEKASGIDLYDFDPEVAHQVEYDDFYHEQSFNFG